MEIILLFFLFCCSGAYGQVTDAELRSISEAIWAADANKFSDSDVVYNINGPTFYSYVNEARFSEPTYATFLDLWDNYQVQIGVAETCGSTCVTEQDTWLNAIMSTGPMTQVHSFLSSKGLASSTVSGFIAELKTYWFQLYSRSSVLDSSGFEHVFLGQVSGTSSITGFNSWIRGYKEEQAGRWVYGGWQDTCPAENVLFSFDWIVNGKTYTKPKSSCLMKVSPELEIALYTLCFQARRNVDCLVSVNNGDFVLIKNSDYGGKDNIGSAYAACQVLDQDIQDVSERIWAADANRFSDTDMTYNIAGPTLYTYTNEARFSEPSYSTFLALFDNYQARVGIVESCDTTCQAEQDNWLNTIMQTGPMREVHAFLSGRGLASSTVSGFISELKTYWFQLYSRSSVLDSSGFEHVFLGEVRGTNEVTGFHNWIQGYLEEKAGRWVYGGWQASCNPENYRFSFDWTVSGTTYTKPISGNFMQTSPEVELALYTLCFRTRRNVDCTVSLDNGVLVIIKNYDYQGKDNIGSAYPEC